MKCMKLFVGLLFIAILFSGVIGMNNLHAEGIPASKMLIVYYSHTGNAKFVAQQIHAHTGAALLELAPVTPYPEDAQETIAKARQEREDGILIELANGVENLDDYDVIFLGSPNWFSTLSLPVLTFLHTHDLSSKTIVPFITFGGGGLANTIVDLKNHVPDATILEEFSVGRDAVQNSQQAIIEWLERVGF